MNIIRFPGLIDIHVHLRDPGATDKEDFYSGTCAALAGGVTTVFDMPNNIEPILTYERLVRKMEIVNSKAVCDFGLYFGSDGKNLDEFKKVENLVIGLKIYLNFTTGNLRIDNDELIEKIFSQWAKVKVIVVHAEEEKLDLAISLCRKYKNKLHITHITLQRDLEKIIRAKEEGLNITCDTTPNYLFLTKIDETTLGGFGKIKPALSTEEDQKFLWKKIKYIDCLATDHAPHTKEEKESASSPSGMPGLETMLPLLLTAYHQGMIRIEDIIRLTNTNPQKIFGFQQGNETYIEVDIDEEWVIKNEDLKTKCGWSPFNGWKMKGKVKRVFIRGTKAFEDGKILADQGFGKNIIK